MKTKEENKQSGANSRGSANGSGEKLFSLMLSYPSVMDSKVIDSGDNGQLASLKAPKYDAEGEELSQDTDQQGEISSGGDDGSITPNSNPSGNQGGPPEDGEGTEDGSIMLGKGNYAKGKATKIEKKAAELEDKTKNVDGKNKKDVQEQESNIQDGKKNVEQKDKENQEGTKKEKQDLKQKADGKKQNLNSEKGKVSEKSETDSKKQTPPANQPAQNETQAPPKKSNKQPNSSKKQGQNFVVDKENAKLFGGSQIVKTTGQGNAVIYAENGLNKEQQSVAQPLPQNIVQEEVNKRKQTNGASIETFKAQSQTQIIQVKTNGDQQQTQLNISHTIAIGQIDIAANEASERIDLELNTAKEQITSQFDGFKEQITSHSQSVVASINAKKEEELANIDSELTSAIDRCTELQENTISSAETSIDTQVQRIRDEAVRLGEVAVQMGNEQANVERAKTVKEQSRWENIKNGGDYEENKKKARVDACISVGKQTKKQFLETAENAAAELLSSKAAIREEITANVTQLKDAFTTQAEDTKALLETKATGHAEQVEAETTSLIAELDSKKASELDALQSFGSAKKAELTQFAAQLKTQLQQQVSSSKQQLQETVSSSISQLTSSQNELISQLQSAREIPIEDFQKMQSDFAQNFQKAAGDIANSVNEMGASSNDGIVSFGNSGVDQLNEAANASVESIVSQKDQAIAAGEGIKTRATTSLDGLKSQAESELTSITESLKGFFSDKITEFTTKFSEASQQIDEDLTKKADEVIAGFEAEINKLPTTLAEKANEAEAAVKPRWRKVLGVIIEIVAAVALAAVVALLVASGVGIIGLIIGGAIAGALIGAGKQMLNNAIDGKPLTEGVAKAMAVGAVEGVFAALTGGAGAQIMSRVGGKLTSMGAGQFVGAVSRFGQRTAGKFAVQALTSISEGASTTIVGNLMDDKRAWNEGLLQSVTNGAINSVIGLGTGQVTNRIQGSNTMGSQLGESMTRRMTREATELGVDFAGNSLSSGAQNVVSNWDKIQAGEAGIMDSFGEGVSNDWETNLIKSGSRNAKTTVTNRIMDAGATRRLQSDGVDAPDLDDGYNYSMNNKGEVDVRRTHRLDADGQALPELTYDSGNNSVVNKPDPNNNSTPEEEGDVPAGRTNKENESDQKAGEGGSSLSPSAQEAESRGLPQAPDGYHYNTSANGTLYIQRTRKLDVDGNELPRLRIDGDQILRDGLTAEHTQTYSSPDDLASTYDPKGRLSRSDRGMIYNYYQQGKWDKIEEILNANASNATGTVWPPSRGGYNVQNEQPIADGASFDRYGNVRYDDDGKIVMENGLPQLTGTFTSPMNGNGRPQPFDSRALDKERNEYDVYYTIEVTGDIDITSNNASVMPWFDKDGNGTQSEWNIPKDPDTGYPLSWNQLEEMGLVKITIHESPSGAVDLRN